MEYIGIYTDGGARGNPGPAAAGGVILDQQGNVLKEISDYLGIATNNVAEYEALLRALQVARRLFGKELRSMRIEVHMDSELIVRQMSGLYKVREPALRERFEKIAQIRLEDCPNIIFTHVRREKNKHADRLVNEAIDRELSKRT